MACADEATALEIYRSLLSLFGGRVDGRMISTDSSFSTKFLPPSNHIVLAPTEPDLESTNVVSDGTLRDRYYLDVRPEDFFLADAWWNAAGALEIIDWQRRCYPSSRSKLIYLIQDFEPGFYPWSTRYALAHETYLRPEVTIPIYDTNLIAQSFHSKGLLKTAKRLVLRPGINPEIARAINHGMAKERIILLHVRSRVARDCHEFVDALVYNLTSGDEKYWAGWRFIAIGDDTDASPFRCGNRIETPGPLPLPEYGQLLSRSSLGVSLMISPHPGYCPLEMAAAGIRVITNAFEKKDISAFHENITSFDRFAVADVAGLVRRAAEQWESDPQAGWHSKPKIDWFFDSPTNLQNIAAAVVSSLDY
jgi:hypothetical protein